MPSRFARYAWFVLVYNVGVILWGAFVRATGSGAGCGEHWPLCNGEVVPRTPQAATVIEFTHRLTSGLAGIFVLLLLVWAFRAFPKGHRIRRYALWSFILTGTEGLLGAALVLLGHTASNPSTWRGVSLTVHLINTLFLLAVLTCTAWFAKERIHAMREPLRKLRSHVITAAVGLLLVGVTGAIAALGDTLFQAGSLAEGLQRDFSPGAHIFLRLRIMHPIAAVLIAGYVVLLGVKILTKHAHDLVLRRLALFLVCATAIQLMLGALNLILLAPVWMQLVHLLAADTVWIAFVLLSAEVLQTAHTVPLPEPVRV